ncbi:MAG: phage holin family protein [Actinomycetota bacterium]|nr:phage holin family protein [Actinomycetota bacterium]
MAQQAAREPIDERPLGELFSALTSSFQQLLRQEIELAKLETKEKLSRAGNAAARFAGMAMAALMALLLLSFAAAWGLAMLIPAGLAFLVVGIVYLIVAGVLYRQGRRQLARFQPVPEQTVSTLKEDAQVIKASVSRGMSDAASTASRRVGGSGYPR